jgi:hypothetical protein
MKKNERKGGTLLITFTIFGNLIQKNYKIGS